MNGKSLGILISCRPDCAGFRHGVNLAETAINNGIDVFLYCLDDAVCGLGDVQLNELKKRGIKLFACAYAARNRNIPFSADVIFCGLGVLSDIINGTDRFVAFN